MCLNFASITRKKKQKKKRHNALSLWRASPLIFEKSLSCDMRKKGIQASPKMKEHENLPAIPDIIEISRYTNLKFYHNQPDIKMHLCRCNDVETKPSYTCHCSFW